MMQKQIHISIRIIDSLAKIVYWFFSLFSVLFFVFMILYVVGVFKEFPLSFDLPIQFDVIEKGKLLLENHAIEVTIERASGFIRLPNIPVRLAVVFMAIYLVLTVAFIIVLNLVNRFISNVKKGLLFRPENIGILRKVSYILFSLWFSFKLFSGVFNYVIINKIQFGSLHFTFTSGSFAGLFWTSIIIWVLSYIFEKGAEMEEENSLTI